MSTPRTEQWIACPTCGHEGFHDHYVDTGQIPGANGEMIDVHRLGRAYPNTSWRCLICDHRWWTPAPKAPAERRYFSPGDSYAG